MWAKERQLCLHSLGAAGWGCYPPWKGQSPRELTEAFKTFRFGPEGMSRLDLDASHVGDIHVDQLGLELVFPSVGGL